MLLLRVTSMSKGINSPSSPLKVLYNPKAFFIHAAWLHQACAHCAIFPTAASVGVWTVSQFQCGWSSSQTSWDRRLVSRYPTY